MNTIKLLRKISLKKTSVLKYKKFTFFYIGNLIAIILALVTQLLIPKLISVDEFGIYKTFTLYLAYASLFHFGYKDGLYIWLCNNKNELKSKKEIFSSVLFIQQILVTIVLFIISYFLSGNIKLIIRLLSFASFFNILYSFFEAYYQSLKNFKPTVYFKFFKEASLFLIILAFYFFGIKITAVNLIYTVVIISFFSFIIYWFYSNWNFGIHNQIIKHKKEIKKIYANGFHLLIGNFTHQLSTNIDKLFISSLFTTQVFGIYAFGTTFFILANVLLTSVSTFLLPYLFEDKKEINNKNSLSYIKLILYPFQLIPVYIIYFFLIVLLINNYFTEYVESLKYFAALNLALVLNISISIVQNNFLKSLKLEKTYSKINIILIGLLIIFFIVFYKLQLDLIFYPIAISVSFLIRFLLNDYFIKSKLCLNFLNFKLFFWVFCNIIFYIIALISV